MNTKNAANSGHPDFVIQRTVSAPRETVWKAFTERDRLMRWFGPKGFAMPTATLDLRPGGVFLYCMKSPDGQDMWGRWVFREIVKPRKLVFVVSFSDPKGGVTRHPLHQSWPLEMLSVAELSEHLGKTTITLRWSALNATDVEHKTFDEGHDGMRMGWTGTFEQLDDYLAKL